MKTKKILVLLTSALLVIGLVAGGATMAYLFDQSGQKQNPVHAWHPFRGY